MRLSIEAHFALGNDFVMMSPSISAVGQVTTSISLCLRTSLIQQTLTLCVLGMWARAALVPFLAIISHAALSSNNRARIKSPLKRLLSKDIAGKVAFLRQDIKLIISASGVDVDTQVCLRHDQDRGM